MADLEIRTTGTDKGGRRIVEEVRRELQRLSDELRATGRASEGMEAELETALRVFKASGREVTELRQELNKLQRSGEGTEESLAELNRELMKAEQVNAAARQEVEQLATEYRESGQSLENFGVEVRKTNAVLVDSQAEIEQTAQELRSAKAATAELNPEINQLSQGLQEADDFAAAFEAEIREYQQAIGRAGTSTQDTRQEINQLGQEIKQVNQALEQHEQQTAKATQELRRSKRTYAETQAEVSRFVAELQQLESGTQGVTAEFAQAIQTYQRANNETIALKTAYIQLRNSGEGTKEEFRQLSQEIQKAQNAEREAIQDTRRLEDAFLKSEQGADRYGDQIKILNEQLDYSQGKIDGVSAAAKRQEAALKGVHGAVDNITKKGPAMVAFGNIMSEMFEEALFAAKRFGEESLQEFYDFDRGLREIQTLAPQMTDTLRREMGEDIQALSIDLGRMSEETIPAVYNALSSGRGTETVLEDVALASSAARAGVAELDDTMKSGLAVLNAYGEETYTLQEIYDQFFYGIKEGVFTMSDLAGGMSALTSISAETRTPLEDIMAALIVMTRQGDSFNEAVELSGLLLTQLGTEGTAAANAFLEATGQSYREFIAQGGTLAEALQMIQSHADRSGQSIGSMIAGNSPFYRDQQAARAALELTGIHLQEITEFSNQARDAQGSMGEAAAIMGEAEETSLNKAKAAWDVFKAGAGEAILDYELRIFGLINTHISLGRAIEGAGSILAATTGAMGTETENMIEDNLAHAQSVEDLVTEYQKLQEADSLYLGLGDVITGTAGEINDGKERIIEALAHTAESFDEYIAALVDMGLAEADAVGAEREYWQEIYNTAQAIETSNSQREAEIARTRQTMTAIQEANAVRRQEQAAVIAHTTALNDNIHAYGNLEPRSEGVNASLARQSVAYQEGIHGLDIYRESLMYAGDEAVATAEDVTLSSETILTQGEILAGYWSTAQGLVEGWSAAQEQGAAAIIAANSAISASYDETFTNALVKQQGLTQADLDTMVAAGLLTQAEAELTWQTINTTSQIDLLVQSTQFAKLSAEEQATAYAALRDGMVQTADGAIALATNGYTPLTGQMEAAKIEATLLKDEMIAIDGLLVEPSVNVPDLSGAISQAERLKQLLSDLSNQGSAGGYGGHQNEGGGVGGGANMPQYASGGQFIVPGGWPDSAPGMPIGVHTGELVTVTPKNQVQAGNVSNRSVVIGGDTFIMNNRGMDEAQAAAQVVMNRRRERANAAARIF